MPDDVGRIADAVRAAQDPGARLRIGRVNAVDTVAGSAQLDITDTAWVPYDVGLTLLPGDRIYAFQQGPTVIIAGKVSGATGPPVGSVTLYAGASTTVPNGWLLAEGQAVSRAQYPVLFQRIGTTYGGGDGATTFNLPNLIERFPVGSGVNRPRGSTGGAATVALTTAQMPAHNHGSDGAHTHSVPSHNALEDVAAGTITAADNVVSGTQTSSSAGGHTHNTEGSGSAHENMPPYVSMHYIIRAV